MKESRYIVVKNPLEGYDFSFKRCHAAEIGAYTIGVLIAILISTLCICDEVFVPMKEVDVGGDTNLHATIAFCKGPLGEEIEFFSSEW